MKRIVLPLLLALGIGLPAAAHANTAQLALAYSPVFDAAPPADAHVDNGLTTSPSKEIASADDTTPVDVIDAAVDQPASTAGLPNTEDPAALATELAQASKNGPWRIVLALSLWLLIFLARRFAVKLLPKLGETKPSMYMAFGIAIASTAALQLYVGRVDYTVLADGVMTALAAIGVHHTGKDAKSGAAS